MKAFLMAAGLGTRLRPITNTIPKCMVPIQGKPLLAWWMDLFEKHGVSDVLINTHYLPESVRRFIDFYNKNPEHHTKMIESYEPILLGSAGTLRKNRDFVAGENSFLICYADNLTNADLTALAAFHKKLNPVLTMGLFHTNNPTGCGIATVDKNNIITEFIEKPEHPKSNLANAGIYLASQSLFNFIPNHNGEIDMGKDVLPLLVGKMAGYEVKEYILDIGTMKNYHKAQEEWKK